MSENKEDPLRKNQEIRYEKLREKLMTDEGYAKYLSEQQLINIQPFIDRKLDFNEQYSYQDSEKEKLVREVNIIKAYHNLAMISGFFGLIIASKIKKNKTWLGGAFLFAYGARKYANYHQAKLLKDLDLYEYYEKSSAFEGILKGYEHCYKTYDKHIRPMEEQQKKLEEKKNAQQEAK